VGREELNTRHRARQRRSGGLGVACFAPIDNGRYFAPIHLVEASQFSIRRCFTGRGWAVLRSSAPLHFVLSGVAFVLVDRYATVRRFFAGARQRARTI
jgi:hypothetical protein